MQQRVVKDLPEGSVNSAFHSTEIATVEEEKKTAVALDAEERSVADGGADVMQDEFISVKDTSVTAEAVCHSVVAGALNLDTSAPVINEEEHMRKRKAIYNTDTAAVDGSAQFLDDFQDSSSKKQKKLLDMDVVTEAIEGILSLDHSATDKIELQMPTKNTLNDSTEHTSEKIVCSGTEENIRDEAKDITVLPEQNQSSSVERQPEGVLSKSEWKPIEKELYLKGVEIFGKNRYRNYQFM